MMPTGFVAPSQPRQPMTCHRALAAARTSTQAGESSVSRGLMNGQSRIHGAPTGRRNRVTAHVFPFNSPATHVVTGIEHSALQPHVRAL